MESAVNIPARVLVKVMCAYIGPGMPADRGRRTGSDPRLVLGFWRQEKHGVSSKASRTANRHRWMGRIYQGERVKPR